MFIKQILKTPLIIFFSVHQQLSNQYSVNRHMKRLSKLSQRPSPYMLRRNKLFQVLLQIPATQTEQIDHNFEVSQTTISSSHKILNELIYFGEAMINEGLNLQKIKKLIEESVYVGSISEQIIDLLFLGLNYHPVSKISNIAYYLCLRSQNFYQLLRKKLRNLIQKSNKNYDEIIFLSDMFYFGLYFTQAEYMEKIVIENLAVNSDEKSFQENVTSKFDSQHFIHYFTHYFSAIIEPKILLKRHRDKIFTIIEEYFEKIVKKYLIKLSTLKNESLRSLRIHYTLENQNKATIQANKISTSPQLDQKQKQFLQNHRKLQKISEEFNTLWNKMMEYSPEVYGEKYRKYVRCLYEQGMFSGLNFSVDEITEEEMLMQIRSSCQNFKNHQFYIQQEIYEMLSVPLKVQPIKPTIQCPIPLLSPQFLEQINNCSSSNEAIKIAQTFLIHYNKHQNRQNIVWQIYKKMHERNNIPYIVRILAEISRIEPQIKYFINEKLNRIRNRQSTNTNHSKPFPPKYFKQYSSLIVEYCKFGLFDPIIYLEDLMKQIKNRDDSVEEEMQLSKGVSSNVATAHTLSISRAAISIPDIIDVLSKMGQHIYYYSLQAHILFNQIIDLIYEGIRNSFVAFEVETVSRFNALVYFLRSINKTSQKINDIGIPLQNIKSERKAVNLAKKYAKSLKEKFRTPEFKNQIDSIVAAIEKSVDNHDFMSSYYYADLIGKVRSKALQKAVLNLTERKIIQQMKKTNIQGAVNWARFLGQLYTCEIIKQKDLLNTLQMIIFVEFFQKQRSGTIKIICSALDTCKDIIIKTKISQEMNECLIFLIKLKKELLRVKGLKSTIVEHEIADIFDYFHPALTTLTTIEEIDDFLQGSDFMNLESSLTALYRKKSKQPLKYKQASPKKTEDTLSTSNCSKELNLRVCELDDDTPLQISHQTATESPKKSPKTIKIITRDRTNMKKASKVISINESN